MKAIKNWLKGMAAMSACMVAAPTHLSAQAFANLVNFNGNNGEVVYGGLLPIGPNLYGTTSRLNAGGYSVFFVNTNGNDFTTLYDIPLGELTSDITFTRVSAPVPFGNVLCGTIIGDGFVDGGSIFTVSPGGGSLGTLYSFPASVTNADGAYPFGVTEAGGSLFGTAALGGTNGTGTIYEIDSNFNFRVIYTFAPATSNQNNVMLNSSGAEPQAPPYVVGNTLYGVTGTGGTNGRGTVFSVQTDGTAYTVLHTFETVSSSGTNSDGAAPLGGVIVTNGMIYGTAYQGGPNSSGLVFALSTNGGGFTVLHSFTGQYDGGFPAAALTLSGSTLYGTTAGVFTSGSVFSLGIDGSQFMVLHSFNGQTDGAVPYSAVILTNGVLYGTTVGGGSFGDGTVYAISLPSPIPDPLTFNSGLWTSNELGTFTNPIINNSTLEMTDGGYPEARSYFLDTPRYIGAFAASFMYQDVGGGGADGVAFVVQNDPRGPLALGGQGNDLGVGGTAAITPSLELELNLYSGHGQNVGFGLFTNGATGGNGANGNYLPTGDVNLASGDIIAVHLQYVNPTLAVTFKDETTEAEFTTDIYVGNLTNFLGSSIGFIGFTGADGGVGSTQSIGDFNFVSLPAITIVSSGTNVITSWPASVVGYRLQQNSLLATTNWVTLTNVPTVVQGENQITLPSTATPQFFRLILQ